MACFRSKTLFRFVSWFAWQYAQPFFSPSTYNGKVGLAILCQITSQVKNYPFEVIIPDGLKIGGAISSDQVKVWIGKSGRQGLFARYPHQR